MPLNQRLPRLLAAAACALLTAILVPVAPAFAADAIETIDAQAFGTSTQMGKNIGIKVIIYQWSTEEDRTALNNAFLQGQNEGLVKALSKMKSIGRIQIPGTVGYDLAFALEVPTPTGRQIKFVTDRKIAFGEAYRNSQSQAFNLTAGEINVNDQDKSKSAGVLYPAAQLIVNADGDLQMELRKNPWRLSNIIVWNAKGKQ